MALKAVEGLTIFHVIAAVLGIVLFITALGLLIRSAVLFNTYPATLILFLALGVAFETYPIIGWVHVQSIIDALPKVTAEAKANPEDQNKQELLAESLERLDKSVYISPRTNTNLKIANDIIVANDALMYGRTNPALKEIK